MNNQLISLLEQAQNIIDQAKDAAKNAVNYVKPTMVSVKGGIFTMGDNNYTNSSPEHSVTVEDFEIGKYPITFDEYDAFCEATGKDKPDDAGWGRGNRPVINVSWYDAIEYCNWLTEQEGIEPCYTIVRDEDDNIIEVMYKEVPGAYALPTEEEWEFAARGGNKSEGFKYSGSDDLDEVGWYGQNSNGQTHPVGEKAPNELGLYDMSGNVWEWTNTPYQSYKDKIKGVKLV